MKSRRVLTILAATRMGATRHCTDDFLQVGCWEGGTWVLLRRIASPLHGAIDLLTLREAKFLKELSVATNRLMAT